FRAHRHEARADTRLEGARRARHHVAEHFRSVEAADVSQTDRSGFTSAISSPSGDGAPVDQESDPALSGTISPPACLAAAGRARNQPAGGDLGRAAAPPDGYGWPGAVNYVRQRRRAAHGEGSGAPKGDRRPHGPGRKARG